MYIICRLQTVLLDYEAFDGNSRPRLETSFWIPIVLSLGSALLLAELLIYFYIFVILLKYNNGLQILTLEKKKTRNKVNAQTLLGQYILFVANVVYVFFLSVAFSEKMGISSDAKDLGVIIKALEFGIFSLVHCVLIPELRIEIRNHLPKHFGHAAVAPLR